MASSVSVKLVENDPDLLSIVLVHRTTSTTVNMGFLVEVPFKVDKFIAGDILLEDNDGTCNGSRWELRRSGSGYMYTMGTMCSTVERYVEHFIPEDDEVIQALIAELRVYE